MGLETRLKDEPFLNTVVNVQILCVYKKPTQPKLMSQFGGRNGEVCQFFSHNNSQSAGVCILIKRNFCCNISNIVASYDGRFLYCDVKIDKLQPFTLCCIYAPNRDSPIFFDALFQNLMDAEPQLIVLGDFNLVLDVNKDREGSTHNNEKAARKLQQLMNECLLTEVWRDRNQNCTRYSWSRGSGDNFQASRIDMALLSRGLDTLCKNVQYIQGVLSDHSQLVLSIADSSHERGAGYWKINNQLLLKEENVARCKLVICKEIQSTTALPPVRRYQRVKSKAKKELQKIAREIADERQLVIAQLSENLNDLEERLPLSRSDMTLYMNTKNELEQIILEKARTAIFRSKVKWAEEGEKNTKYFLNLERSRANAKTCHAIFDEQNNIITDPEKILKQQQLFYQRLYTADPQVVFQYENNTTKRVNEEQKRQMNATLNLEELKRATFQFAENKTPGPDGLTAEFYKVFWDEFGPLLLEMYNDIFNEGKMEGEMSEGILNLIPKAKKDQRILKNLRPITLLNTDYKIIEKVLANRMYPAIQQLVDPEQTGFMPGRRMCVNLRKTLDTIRYCELQKKDAVMINLDFHKAFDSVEIPSILAVLQYFDFPDYIIEWIRILYDNFKVKVQNNGNFSQTINIGRSVHQGGCASAPIFNLCAQILCNELKKNTDILPIDIQNRPQLLDQYADDTDIFSENSQSSITAIENTLNNFAGNVGLKINYDKTTVYRIGSLKNSNAELYTTKPIAWTSEGINMLGTYVTTENILWKNYEEVLKKAAVTLNRWKTRNLTLIGKITIINVLVASLFVHKMMVLPTVSEKIVQNFNSMLTDFIWNGKRSKIKLAILQTSRRQGGLNLVNIRIRDMALKITWIQILNDDPICAHISMSVAAPVMGINIFKCCFRKEDVKYICPKSTSDFWDDVLSAWAAYCNCVESDVIRDQVLWWNSSIRIGGKPFIWRKCYDKGLMWLTDIFPNGRSINPQEAMERFGITTMQLNSLLTAIPENLRTMAKRGNTSKITIYDEALKCKNLSQKAYCKLMGTATWSEQLTLRWAKDINLSQEQLLSALKGIYVVTNLPKLRSFQFRLLNRALVFNTHLARWGIVTSPLCTQCIEAEPETLYHCLFSCPPVRELWNAVQQWMESLDGEITDFSYRDIMLNLVTKDRTSVKNFYCVAVQAIYICTKMFKKASKLRRIQSYS